MRKWYAKQIAWVALCALTLGSSRASAQGAAPGSKLYTLATPVADLIALVRAQVFTDAGRYYPCRGNPSCAAWGESIALSDPALSIDGTRLVFSVKMVGTYAVSPYFAPQVAGTLVVSGVPVVIDNRVRLSDAKVDAGPSDVTFQAFVQATHVRMEKMVTESGGFDLAQYLASGSRDPRLPPPRLPGLHCVDSTEIHLQTVQADAGAAAITAVVVGPSATPRRAC
jgi:hypothetical protein